MNRRIFDSAPRLFLLVFGVAGCGDEFEPGPPFDSAEDVKVWATSASASAVAVYVNAYEPVGVADGELSFADPLCPETTDDGTVLTITGGCTDSTEREWKGRATVTRDGDDRELVLSNYNGARGNVIVRRVGPTLREFEASLVLGGVTTISYAGSVEGDYTGPTLWNGSGRVERHGYFRPIGAVDATTTDELVDDAVCSGQPSSGTTTLHARGDTAVVTYDGVTDCDDTKNARLSVNGEDRGLIDGILCSAGNVGSRGASGTPGFVLVLAALVACARRSRPNG